MSRPLHLEVNTEDTKSRSDEESFRRVKQLWDAARVKWQPYRMVIGDELGFSQDLEHYADDSGLTRDRRRIQPRGQELFSLIRHKASQIAKSEIYLNPRPVDDVDDGMTSEVVRDVMEWEIHHPQKGYAEIRELVVIGALSARAWAASLDFHPDCGPYGEILPRLVDPRCLMWDDAYHSMHHPACPWAFEEVQMPLSRIRKMKGWKNTEQVMPDNGERALRDEQFTGIALADVDLVDQATIVKCWFRYDDETKRGERPGSYRNLAPEKRYMACPQCGYQSDNQEQLAKSAGDDSFELPELDVCPQCGGLAERQDAMVTVEEVLAYPNGRLVILAPYSGVVLYDDAWPIRMRSFPYLYVTAYPHPTKPMGISDTSANWTMQLISNALLRMGYEQMAENRDLTIIPELGVVDVSGLPYRFGDDQGRFAFYNTDMPPGGVQHFQGSGLNQAWGVFHGAVQGVFKGNMGTSDLGLTPQMSKDIPVGTVRSLIETGEVPVDAHIRRLRRAECVFFGVWLDMVRETYSERRLSRLKGPAGSDMMVRLRGMTIPNADIVVEGAPRSYDLSQERVQAFTTLMQVPPPFRRVFAKLNNFPPSVLAELERAQFELEEQQLAMGGIPGAPPGEAQGPPPGAPPEPGALPMSGGPQV